MNEEERRRRRKAERRAKRHREEFPGKVRVVHPGYGEVIVPGASPYAALLCAAERWGCDWMDIRDAEVLAVESAASDATSSVTADAATPSTRKGHTTSVGQQSCRRLCNPRGEGIKKSSRPGQGPTAKRMKFIGKDKNLRTHYNTRNAGEQPCFADGGATRGCKRTLAETTKRRN